MKSIYKKTNNKIVSVPLSVLKLNLKFPSRAFDPVAYAAALEILG